MAVLIPPVCQAGAIYSGKPEPIVPIRIELQIRPTFHGGNHEAVVALDNSHARFFYRLPPLLFHRKFGPTGFGQGAYPAKGIHYRYMKSERPF